MASKKAFAVSIIMPTWNRPALLRKAVASVERQSFSDWELIIVDDASTDDTPQVIAELAKRDPRVRGIRNDENYHPDISRTLDRGLEAARGKYIARLDDDDHWIDDDKLKKQFEFLESHPDHVIVGGGMVVVDERGKERYRFLKKETDAEIRKFALSANPFAHTTVMFRADAALAAGGYAGWRFAEDWDLWLKMGMHGKFYNFPEYFTAYLFTGDNKSFRYLRPQSRMILQFIASHRREYPGFWRGYLLNGAQYLYSFLPFFIRRPLQNALASLKRKAF